MNLEQLDLATDTSPDQLLAFDESLERLAADDATAADLVKLLYYAGLGVEQAARVLGVSSATAYRHWAYARAWLHCDLNGGQV